MDQLFKKVFNNIVLSRLIFEYSRLYKKYECFRFTDRITLQLFKEREYISIIEYWGYDILKRGDLPIDGVLKEIRLCRSELLLIQSDAIPSSVEIIDYGRIGLFNKSTDSINQFSNLPSTINTLKDIIIIEPNNPIPSNITSISFIKCPILSSFAIPNTIKELKFGRGWDNGGVVLNKGDIPEGVAKLGLGYYNIHNLTEGILPNSTIELEMVYENSDGLFDFLPHNLETLIINCSCKITPESNLITKTSFKKLAINFTNGVGQLEVNSLPKSSITELTLKNVKGMLKMNMIPNSITKLDLTFISSQADNILILKDSIPNNLVSLKVNKIIQHSYILPSSLKHLEIIYNGYTGNYNIENLLKMVSILPKSLISITLPERFKQFNLELPPTINKIYYK